VGLYILSPIHLHGIVPNRLSTGTALPRNQVFGVKKIFENLLYFGLKVFIFLIYVVFFVIRPIVDNETYMKPSEIKPK
jgi:hypothetical protein